MYVYSCNALAVRYSLYRALNFYFMIMTMIIYRSITVSRGRKWKQCRQ